MPAPGNSHVLAPKLLRVKRRGITMDGMVEALKKQGQHRRQDAQSLLKRISATQAAQEKEARSGRYGEPRYNQFV